MPRPTLPPVIKQNAGADEGPAGEELVLNEKCQLLFHNEVLTKTINKNNAY